MPPSDGRSGAMKAGAWRSEYSASSRHSRQASTAAGRKMREPQFRLTYLDPLAAVFAKVAPSGIQLVASRLPVSRRIARDSRSVDGVGSFINVAHWSRLWSSF